MKRGLLAGIVLALSLVASGAGAIEIKQVTSPLGIKAWLVEDKSAPVIALSFSFAGGSATEPKGQIGVTSLMATMLTDGAGTMPANAFRLRQEEASASLGFSASSDRLSGGLRILTANRSEGFELLRTALTAPRFDSDMLEQRRAQSLAALNQSEQRPASVAERLLMQTMFAHHPYAPDPIAVRATLKIVTPADLKSRAADLLTRHGLLVAAVGDIDAAELGRELDRVFGDLPAGGAEPAVPDWVPPDHPTLKTVEKAVPQSAVRIGFPGLVRSDPDWYPAQVMVQILGGGMQSRLFNEVREKRGLAYSVSASLRSSEKAGVLTISTGSANERVAEALDVIRAELVRFHDEGVTESELEDAKTYISGALALSLDSSGAIAGLLHSIQVDRLPADILDRRTAEIAAVTQDDVRRVARRLLDMGRMTTVVVGKPVGLTGER